MPAHAFELPHPALCINAHTRAPRLAVGLTTGGAILTDVSDFHSLSSSTRTKCKPTFPFELPCRALSFVSETDKLLAAQPEGHVLLFDAACSHPTQEYLLPKQSDDDSRPSATVFTAVDASVVVAGDDAGGLHVLDLRSPSAPVASVLEQGDYVSAIVPVSSFGTDALLVSSGDGTLCAYELRAPPRPRLRLQYATDAFDDDLLSLASLPGNAIAVAGTLSGALNLYTLRFLDKGCESEAAAHVDRFYGHPECVNAVLGHGEDGVVLTASSDGIVRVVDVMNKALLGVLEYGGEEEGDVGMGKTSGKGRKKRKKESWPIESMVSIAGLAKPAFALLGHDELIRLCNGASLVDEDEPEDKARASEPMDDSFTPGEELLGPQGEQRTPRGKKKRKKFESVKPGVLKDFFDDL